jgi:hypothetical protein
MVVELQAKAALIPFGTLGRRLGYAQVEVDFCAFGSSFSEQLPLIGAGLEVGDGFSTVAFDRRLVVSPDFPEQEKGRRENKEKEIGVGTLWWMEEKIETTLFFIVHQWGESKLRNLAASTSLSNSPRYMYLHPSMAFEELPIHCLLLVFLS